MDTLESVHATYRSLLVKCASVVTWFSTYDIANPDTPPWWVGLIPSMRRLWQNPVAQFNYRRGKLIRYPLILVSFAGSLVISLLLNFNFTFIKDEDISLQMGFWVTMFLPIVVAMPVGVFRILISCLVGTSILLRRRLEAGMLNQVLPTPLSDARILNGELFRSMVSGLVVLEMVLGLSIGLTLGFLLVMGRSFLASSVIDINEFALWLPTILLWFIAAPILMTFLFTYASGLYSLMMPTVIAVPIALGHIALTVGFTSLMRFTYHAILSGPEPGTLVFFIGELLQVGVLAGIIVLTARIGVMVFARYRRPGFFETEWSSAAGLASWE